MRLLHICLFITATAGSSSSSAHLSLLQPEHPSVTCPATASVTVLADRFALARNGSQVKWISDEGATDSGVILASQSDLARARGMLPALLQQWQGNISFSVLVAAQQLEEAVQWCNQMAETAKEAGSRLHLHWVVGTQSESGYPVNIMRNIALQSTKTQGWVLLIDADDLPAVNATAMMEDVSTTIAVAAHHMTKNCTALILPAFEDRTSDSQLLESVRTSSNSKEQLLEWLKQDKVKPKQIYAKRSAYAGPFKFKKWMKGETHQMVEWEEDFEPYVLLSHPFPAFPENFFGFGKNKIMWHRLLATQEFSYISLGSSWSLDRQPRGHLSQQQLEQKQHNEQLYARMKLEHPVPRVDKRAAVQTIQSSTNLAFKWDDDEI